MLEVSQARRLKELEKEKARLKRIVADQMLGMKVLQEALEKSCEPRPQPAAPDPLADGAGAPLPARGALPVAAAHSGPKT